MQVGQRSALREVTPVVHWRREQLVGAGFSRQHAWALARDLRWDLHRLIELAERGCPPELAARILAPLDPHDREAA
jgi:hypothetical protein